MGRRDNGDLRLLSQIEPKPQGTMRGQIADERIGQGAVFIFFITGPLFLFPLVASLGGVTVGVIRPRCIATFFALGVGLLVPRANEPAFNPDRQDLAGKPINAERVIEEEAQHFPRRVRPSRIRI